MEMSAILEILAKIVSKIILLTTFYLFFKMNFHLLRLLVSEVKNRMLEA